MTEILLDSLIDTAKLLPFFLVLYIFIEFLEHETAMGHPMKVLSGRAAPFLGAATGLVPLCGFSVMAAKLYERRYLTLGTLLAVFVSTSDEGLLVLLLSGMDWADKLVSLAALIGCKLVYATAVGYLCDLIFKKAHPQTAPDAHFHSEHSHSEHSEHSDMEHGAEEELSVCEHRHEDKLTHYLWSPLLHALEIAAIVFLLNVGFGLLFTFLGEDKVIGFLQGTGYWYQPLVAALVGLIPNCASSVVIAEVYAAGGIAFGSLLGGLVTNAGAGVLILFRNVKETGRNFLILGGTLLLGIVAGYAVNALALLF